LDPKVKYFITYSLAKTKSYQWVKLTIVRGNHPASPHPLLES